MVCFNLGDDNSYMKYEDLNVLEPQDLPFDIGDIKMSSPFDQPNDDKCKVTLLIAIVVIVLSVAAGLWWLTGQKANNGPTIYPDNGIVKQIILWQGHNIPSVVYESKTVKVIPGGVILDNGTCVMGSVTVSELEDIPVTIRKRLVSSGQITDE